jgi:uncharacterized Fe-S cluster-containing MiaB family protein
MAIRERPWLCSTCGYMMDAASSLRDEAAVPKEGDLSLCLNCTASYERRGKVWRALSVEDERDLPEGVRREILSHRVAQQMARLPALNARGGRA